MFGTGIKLWSRNVLGHIHNYADTHVRLGLVKNGSSTVSKDRPTAIAVSCKLLKI